MKLGHTMLKHFLGQTYHILSLQTFYSLSNDCVTGSLCKWWSFGSLSESDQIVTRWCKYGHSTWSFFSSSSANAAVRGNMLSSAVPGTGDALLAKRHLFACGTAAAVGLAMSSRYLCLTLDTYTDNTIPNHFISPRPLKLSWEALPSAVLSSPWLWEASAGCLTLGSDEFHP